MPNDGEFARMANLYLEGMLGEVDLRAFEHQIAQDSECAEQFAAWCLMHRQILDLQTEDRLHALMDEFVTAMPGPRRMELVDRAAGVASCRTPQSVSLESKRRRVEGSFSGRRRAWQIAYLAGVALAVAVLIGFRDQLPLRWDFDGGSSSTDTARSLEVSDHYGTIASLTRLVDPVWPAEATVLDLGQQLRPGSRVQLKSGRVKVTFHCGAEVALEGPCDFEIHDTMIGILRSGKMTADVPRRAFAFAVLCPGVELVDLGTSFGVAVEANGKTELHVFEGEVLCNRSPNNDGLRSPAGLHVKARQAVEFSAQDDPPSDIAVDEKQFSGLISLRRGVHQELRQWTTRDLALWLAADIAVITDQHGLVPCWPDLVYGDNVSAEDAVQSHVQARPRLVENTVNGLPAVRFDGQSDYLLTTPLETTDDQTVLLVCQFSPKAFDPNRIWGGQIINYDGPPNRYLSTTLEPGVLQIGEPLLEDEFRPSLVTGQVFAGFIGSATVESGRVNAVPVGPETPVIVVYRYDYTGQVAELWINGQSFGTARAFAPQGITSRKIIGRHAWKQLFFHGDLAELLIFNRALSQKDLAETTAYLADKYKISLTSSVAESVNNQR